MTEAVEHMTLNDEEWHELSSLLIRSCGIRSSIDRSRRKPGGAVRDTSAWFDEARGRHRPEASTTAEAGGCLGSQLVTGVVGRLVHSGGVRDRQDMGVGAGAEAFVARGAGRGHGPGHCCGRSQSARPDRYDLA